MMWHWSKNFHNNSFILQNEQQVFQLKLKKNDYCSLIGVNGSSCKLIRGIFSHNFTSFKFESHFSYKPLHAVNYLPMCLVSNAHVDSPHIIHSCQINIHSILC
jgi:hypothetical protein